ncbi:MAG: hypothetical protein OXM55_01390 [Bdellovibrionales bacterium]|nr:hypothetical protein [Bdellovibrionales bacterium]
MNIKEVMFFTFWKNDKINGSGINKSLKWFNIFCKNSKVQNTSLICSSKNGTDFA